LSAEYLVGTSRWNYDHWKGRFYPEDVPEESRVYAYYNNDAEAYAVKNAKELREAMEI
jgi:uncharacterized protein YecE (DUF72 family)